MPYHRALSLAKKALRGALWTVGAGVAARFIGVLGTLVITRFLAPEVVGEVGVAVIFMYTASQVSRLGFDQYVVAKPKATRATVFHAALFNIVAAVVAIGVGLAVAEPLAPHFGAPGMVEYVPGMALVVLMQRVSLIPERVVVRDMRFRVFALGTSLPELLYTGVSVGLAAAGWGGHAIVVGNICQYAFRGLFFLVAVSWRDWLTPSRIDRETTADIFRFGIPIAIGSISGFAASKWDNMIISRMFGPAIMGAYNLAYNLSQIPAEYIGVAIADVLMPSFANMKPSGARLAIVRSIRLLALVVFPLAVGLGAVADTLVATIFNDEWQGIAPFLMALAFPAVAGPVGDAIHVYLKARDMPRAVMGLNVTCSVALLGMVALLGLIGPLPAALGVGVAGFLYAGLAIAIANRVDRVPVLPILAGVAGPLAACAVMAGAVFALRALLDSVDQSSMPVRLGLEIAAGAVVYVVAAFALAGSTARELLGLLRDALNRG